MFRVFGGITDPEAGELSEKGKEIRNYIIDSAVQKTRPTDPDEESGSDEDYANEF